MKKIILTFVAVSSLNIVFAQRYTAKFEGGTEIDYEIMEKYPDQQHKLKFYLYFPHYSDVVNVFGVSYFEPDKYTIKANIGGPGAFSFEGLYFLNSSVKPKETSVTLKSTHVGSNTILKHVVKPEIDRKTYYGIHGGYAYKSAGGIGRIYRNGFAVHEMALGVGLTRSRHIKMLVHSDKKPVQFRGLMQFSLYGDLLLYPIKTKKDTESDLTKSDISSIGFRTYLEGKASTWGKKDWGFYYLLGAGITTNTMYPIVGIGIYAGF